MQDLEMGTSVVNEEFVVAVGSNASNVNVVAFVNEFQQQTEASDQVRRYIIIICVCVSTLH